MSLFVNHPFVLHGFASDMANETTAGRPIALKVGTRVFFVGRPAREFQRQNGEPSKMASEC